MSLLTQVNEYRGHTSCFMQRLCSLPDQRTVVIDRPLLLVIVARPGPSAHSSPGASLREGGHDEGSSRAQEAAASGSAASPQRTMMRRRPLAHKKTDNSGVPILLPLPAECTFKTVVLLIAIRSFWLCVINLRIAPFCLPRSHSRIHSLAKMILAYSCATTPEATPVPLH